MSKILVTTTELLSGMEIESYVKPIFANVVIGTNIFSDFSASLTDIFGGRSSTYEKKLQSLNDNALQILKSKASELGANCIIGLKINSQQISGKNVQMFMVSAYGTAVIARNISSVRQPTLSSKELDKSTVIEKAALIKLLNDSNNQEFKFTIQSIELILESKSEEFASLFLSKFIEFVKLNAYDENQNNAKKLLFEYFGTINPETTIPLLYEALRKESSERVIKELLLLIKEYDLVDIDQCLVMLDSEEISVKKIALIVLRYDKPTYIHDDINALQKTITKIENSFPNLSSTSIKKGFLSSNEKEVWICKCGKSNEMSTSYCFNCQYNAFGFKSDELQPATIITQLHNKVEALKEIFNHTTELV
ncbi:heavy metal-binding domain-containing protein [Mucilaginibacter litoreus]|uniref:UPF0145 protein ACFQZX_12870 n=1 Tax=Mucilaginibacter litoreus TaxID=1048221 RepID=A0ABW3AVL9_9SPHI